VVPIIFASIIIQLGISLTRPLFLYTTCLPYHNFELLYLMTLCHPGALKYENETYSSRPFIWYATCLPSKNFGFLHLMTPYHSRPYKYEIWNILFKTFHMRYTTCLPCKNFGYLHLMTPPHPLDGIENMNFETYSPRHFFWYTTCIPYHSFALHFCTWWPRPTRIPQIWQLRPTLQDLSYHMQHAYLLRTLDFYTWWPRPTPSMGSKTLFFWNFGTYSSRPFFWYTTCLSLNFCTWWTRPTPGS